MENVKIQIRPGWLIVDTSTATGGVRYERKALGEKRYQSEGLETKFQTTKVVDHTILCRDIDCHVKKVDYVLRKHCARAGFGWFADDAALKAVRAEVDKLAAQAEELNTSAQIAGCARRARIGIVPARIEIASEDAAREIARTVRDILGAIRDALRAGETRGLLATAVLRARNLDKLAVGMQAESIRFALETVPGAKKALLAAIEAGKTPADAGAALDLGQIEGAITLFTPPDEEEDMGTLGSALLSMAVAS